MKICVIGAGVIGLSSAVAIQNRLPEANVTIIADKFGRHTTSNGSGGLICSFVNCADEETGRQWFKDGFDYFLDLAFSSQAKDAGIIFLNGISLTNEDKPSKIIKNLVNVNKLDPKVLQKFYKHFENGYTFTTPLVDMPVYLPWLLAKFIAKGGKTIERTIKSLHELNGQYDLVINCSGFGSRELVNDPLMKPVRGQVLHVKAPWVKTGVFCPEASLQIFPFADSVFVGGIKQPGRSDVTLSEEDSKHVWTRAQEVYPPLKGAKVLWEWSGIRPQRATVRLEEETIMAEGKSLKVIHNYGHGSLGITASWGCALHAARLAEKILKGSKARL